MLLKLCLLFTTLIAFSSGYKYTACNFDSSYEKLCGWDVEPRYNCQWAQKLRHHGKKGYLYLNGADYCTSTLTKTSGMFSGWAAEYFTIEYYVIGPGPFTLKVSTDKYDKIWLCEIQPRNSIKRMAHVFLSGNTKYLYIFGKVAKGSQIIITQIWDDIRGGSVQTYCPLLPTTWIPTTKPTTVKTTTTKRPTPKLTKKPTTRLHQTTKITSFSKPINRKTPTLARFLTTNMSTWRIRRTTKLSTRIRTKSNIPTRIRPITKLSTLIKPITKNPTTIRPIATEIPTLSINTNTSSSIVYTPCWTTFRETPSHTSNISTEHVKTEGNNLHRKEQTRNIIVGSVVGVLVSIILVIFVVFIMKRRTRKYLQQIVYDQHVSKSEVCFENKAYL